MTGETVTLEPLTGQDNRQQPLYGPPATFPCILQQSNRRAVSSESGVNPSTGAANLEELMSICILDSCVPVSMGDRITFSDGEQPPILVIVNVFDRKTLHHYEVYTTYALRSV